MLDRYQLPFEPSVSSPQLNLLMKWPSEADIQACSDLGYDLQRAHSLVFFLLSFRCSGLTDD